MSNWKPASVEELQKNYQFNLSNKNFWRRVLVLSVSTLLTIYRYPLPTLQIILFFKYPNWYNGIGILLATLVGVFSRNIVFYTHSSVKLRELISFLEDDVLPYFRITPFSLETYIDADTLVSIRATRVLSLVNPFSIGQVYVMEPISSNVEFLHRKGFVIPFTNKLRPSSPLIEFEPTSAIFVRDVPEDITLTGNFQVLHEVGHMTSYAWKVQLRPYEAIANILVVIAFIIILTGGQLQRYLLWLLPYILYLLWIIISKARNRLHDEHVADIFAIKRIHRDEIEKTVSRLRLIPTISEERMKIIQSCKNLVLKGFIPNENSIVFEHSTICSVITLSLIVGVLQFPSLNGIALVQVVIEVLIFYLILLGMRRVLRRNTNKLEYLLRGVEQEVKIN